MVRRVSLMIGLFVVGAGSLWPSASHAATAADCITLLNDVSSAVSRIDGWQGTGGVMVTALGDNGPAIDRVTKDLTRAREAYDLAIACAISDEARRSSGFAQAQERFGRDFPKYQQAIVEGAKQYETFKAAIDADNAMKDLVRRVMGADAAAYESELANANAALAKAATVAASNPFLGEEWRRGVDSGLHGHLTSLQQAKGKLNKEAARAAIRANAVVKTAPEFTRDDAMNPRKVAEAFAKMPAAARVALQLGESRVFHRYTPVSRSHPVTSNLEKSYPGDREPATAAFVFYNQKTIFVRYKKDELPKLTAPVPGLVWDVLDDKQVIFVSVSGGRYVTRIDHLIPAAEVTEPLAADIVHGMLIHDDVVELSRLGVLDARYGRDMAAAKEAYGACADKVWKAKQAAFDKIETADILNATRVARRMTLDGQVRAKIDGKCAAPQRKYSAAWDQAMAEYTTLRSEVLRVAAAPAP